MADSVCNLVAGRISIQLNTAFRHCGLLCCGKALGSNAGPTFMKICMQVFCIFCKIWDVKINEMKSKVLNCEINIFCKIWDLKLNQMTPKVLKRRIFGVKYRKGLKGYLLSAFPVSRRLSRSSNRYQRKLETTK